MALFAMVADKDSVRNLMQRGVSYNQIGSYNQSLHLYATWMSSRSVNKFGKRYDNFIVITTVVRWEHHSYNRTLTSRLSKVYFTGLQGCSTNETWSKSLWFTGKGKPRSVFCTLLWFQSVFGSKLKNWSKLWLHAYFNDRWLLKIDCRVHFNANKKIKYWSVSRCFTLLY